MLVQATWARPGCSLLSDRKVGTREASPPLHGSNLVHLFEASWHPFTIAVLTQEHLHVASHCPCSRRWGWPMHFFQSRLMNMRLKMVWDCISPCTFTLSKAQSNQWRATKQGLLIGSWNRAVRTRHINLLLHLTCYRVTGWMHCLSL